MDQAKNGEGQSNTQPDKNGEGQKSVDSKPGSEKSGRGNKDVKSGAKGNSQKQDSSGGDKKPGDGKDGQSPKPVGNSSGEGISGERTGPATDPQNGVKDPPAPANAEFQKKAGDLQLETFKKKVTKDMLKELKWTEEEYQQFLKKYAEMLSRRTKDPATGQEKLPDPKRGAGNLKNQGPRQVKGSKTSDDRAMQGGKSLPPPEFREKYQEFTQKLSELERSREKK